MPRELPTYRENLERLNAAFEKEIITRKEVCAYLGVSYNTSKRLVPFAGTYTSKANLAHALAEIGRTV